MQLVDEDPETGRHRYQIYGFEPSFEDETGSDLSAIAGDRISVTPVHFDLTDRPSLDRLQGAGTSRGCSPGPEVVRTARPPRSGEPGEGGKEARRGAAAGDRASTTTATTCSTTRDLGHRLRRPAARAAGDRGGEPGAAHPRLADPAGRREAARQVQAGRAPRADALARQRPQRGRAAGLGEAGRAPARAPRHLRARDPLRHRAEGRRPGDLADLRERRLHPRRHARRRPRSARTSPRTCGRSRRSR